MNPIYVAYIEAYKSGDQAALNAILLNDVNLDGAINDATFDLDFD